MKYNSIMKQSDYQAAASKYVVEQFGQDVALVFPTLTNRLVRSLMSGEPESVYLEGVLVAYSIKPLIKVSK